ncbi:phosphotransferase [candidate division KSB1 bacterium]|nr:phosphotransferase [candidate division KSB1 bacterium]
MVDNWLLCDFHIHTNNSDGELSLQEVVDLYGRNGFDVIGISDHILDKPRLLMHRYKNEQPHAVEPEQFGDYLRTLWHESRRAWEEYGMLLIPGAEITNNTDGYHILCIDIKEYIEPSQTVEKIVNDIHRQGAIAVAPHPHRGADGNGDALKHLWDNHEKHVHLFDAWEVANRDDLFTAVGLKRFNYIANSDFHHPRHIFSWKSLLRCRKNVEAVKAEIRNNVGVSIYLFREDKAL